ncbi:hypothetical protein K443DRAFT_193959 [Laccaria amethystina LaAM-08-1]|uniref:Uncharacterized protein n=1 Tax=Laccaria amethystina LaAM-08-1 TaxID=1095629 RepID=A0A0C9XSH6_9AGAR|nr:hypothetical protein K443DRAFT_193959 [Laccaria amethystina LaAM-08-1]
MVSSVIHFFNNQGLRRYTHQVILAVCALTHQLHIHPRSAHPSPNSARPSLSMSSSSAPSSHKQLLTITNLPRSSRGLILHVHPSESNALPIHHHPPPGYNFECLFSGSILHLLSWPQYPSG